MNFYLDKNQIQRLASNSEVYVKGMRIYSENRESRDEPRLDFLEKPETKEVTIHTLFNDERSVFTSVTFNQYGLLREHECDCYAHSMWKGACKHVVALLLHILNSNQEQLSAAKSARAAREFLENLEKLAYSEMDGLLPQTGIIGNISLVPEFMLAKVGKDNHPYLQFKIGREKLYLLRDVQKFERSLASEEVVAYGKSLEFAHKLSAFSDSARELISIIKNDLPQYAIQHNKGVYGPSIRKALFLSPASLDRLFELEKGAGQSGEVSFVEGNPEIKLKLTRRPEGLEIAADREGFSEFRGERHAYVYLPQRQTVHRVSDGYCATLELLHTALWRAGTQSLTIKKAHFGKFAAFLYPRLREYKLADIPDGFLEEIETPYIKPQPKLYFDADGSSVTCKALFVYGDKEVNPLKPEDGAVSRNPLEEYAALQTLSAFGFVPDKERGQYVLSGEELIYDFYFSETGAERLRERAEVFATEGFKSRSFKKSLSASFGLRINGNLLEISVNTTDYPASELSAILEAYALKKKYYPLKDGSFVSLPQGDPETEAAAKLWSGLGLDSKSVKNGVVSVPKYRSLYIGEAAEGDRSRISWDKGVERLLADFANFRELDFTPPATLHGELRHYQTEGCKWLKTLSRCGFGGILADDMGLGKTIQIIALLLSEKEAGKEGKSLVVAPTSLIYNWEKEIERFAPSLKTALINGPAQRRAALLGEVKRDPSVDVLITTYDTLKRDLPEYEGFHFLYIVADEAQNIKNPGTQNARAIKSLDAETRFALTGTPIENSLSELWSIFDFVMSGYLFSYTKFSHKYEHPIVRDENGEAASELRRQIAPFILRRLKKDVLTELPDKIETTLYAEMTGEQEKVYSAYLMKARGEIDGFIREKKNIDMLAALTRLRQICCHPGVFLENYSGGSGKLDLTLETVASLVQSGRRILLFSQFTSMLAILMEHLRAVKIPFFYLDGATDSKTRLDLTNRFNSGENSVFLISLKAGGTGLNLVGADVVVHFDPWWNPAVMSQATDRAHRIGQKNVVQVFNIVTKDSVEEKILELQTEKLGLIDSVIAENNISLGKMSEDELKYLFA